MPTIAEVGMFLLQHGDLVIDLLDVLQTGDAKPLLQQAIRDIKVKMSDAAMREELVAMKKTAP